MARIITIAGVEYPVRFTLRDVLVACDKHSIAVEEIADTLGGGMSLKAYDFLLDVASLGLSRAGEVEYTSDEVDVLLTNDISALTGIVEALMDSLTCGSVFPTAPTSKVPKQKKNAK